MIYSEGRQLDCGDPFKCISQSGKYVTNSYWRLGGSASTSHILCKSNPEYPERVDFLAKEVEYIYVNHMDDDKEVLLSRNM